MEKIYSTIFIVDISQNPDEVETITSRVQQLIEDHGGIIRKIDRWGKRRLAYPIKKKTHGYYVEVEYSANSRLNIPKILENEYRLNDRVLRYLNYIIDKKELKQRARKAVKKQKEETPKATANEISSQEEIASNETTSEKNISNEGASVREEQKDDQVKQEEQKERE